MENFIYEDMSPETAQAFAYFTSLEAQEEAEEIRKATTKKLNYFNKILNNLEYKNFYDGYKILVKNGFLDYFIYYHGGGGEFHNIWISINLGIDTMNNESCESEKTIQPYFVEKEREILNNSIINQVVNKTKKTKSL